MLKQLVKPTSNVFIFSQRLCPKVSYCYSQVCTVCLEVSSVVKKVGPGTPVTTSVPKDKELFLNACKLSTAVLLLHPSAHERWQTK